MLLGIDVGGTFTDAVLVENGAIIRQAKVPTDSGRILESILAALDESLHGIEPCQVERVALSTTLVTNSIVEGKTDKVGLVMMPGPGADWHGRVPGEPIVLGGYVDHRGRVRQDPDIATLRKVCQNMMHTDLFAVSGKFSVRNPDTEQQVARCISQEVQPLHVTCGAAVSGGLNFIRRTNSAYYNAAVWKRFRDFADGAEAALKARGIQAPVFILKADGGTLPLAKAREHPVESIFTGPAASVLGVMALCLPQVPAVSLDIGGTTTDIALWNNGAPLFDAKGAAIAGYLTAVRAFRLKSVGIGGDSWVRREAGKIAVGPHRKGRAMALGGPEPTVTDALIVTGALDAGNPVLAAEAIRRVSFPGESVEETAQEILETAGVAIRNAIVALLETEAATPVYRVEDIVRASVFEPKILVGVGGAAGGLIPIVAAKMGMDWHVPRHATVANAAGAALARPTFDITLRADTSLGEYTVPELGLRRQISSRGFSMQQARQAAAAHLAEVALSAGISAVETETIHEEEFNLVRGFNTVGRIITIRSQVKPGVIEKLTDGKEGGGS